MMDHRWAGLLSARKAMLAVAFCATTIAILGLLAPQSSASPPQLDARAWHMIDASNGDVLASSQAEEPLPVASTTKLMTAWVAMRELDFGQQVPVADYQASPVESLMGLVPGESVTVRDLMYGLILSSGNDAAYTLAKAAGGSIPRFVAMMNRAAERLQLHETHYGNPIGLDEPDAYSSASDLTRLAAVLMRRPRFRRVASSATAELTSVSDPRTVETRNTLLLEHEWVNGVKTGHTLGAGYVLVGSGVQKGVPLVTAVLGADSESARDSETERLLEYGFGLYSRRTPLKPRSPAAEVPVKYEDEALPLRPARRVTVAARGDQSVSVDLAVPDEVEGPIGRMAPVGLATVSIDERRVARVELLAARGVQSAGLLTRATHSTPVLVAIAIVCLFVILIGAVLARNRLGIKRTESDPAHHGR